MYMKKNRYLLSIAITLMTGVAPLAAQTPQLVHYTGTELSNPYEHDGQLSPVVGVHNIQVVRANREHPSKENGNGWTYNHQSMMAYWNGQFYMHYLSDPKDEHLPPSFPHFPSPARSETMNFISFLPHPRRLYQRRPYRQCQKLRCYHAPTRRVLYIQKRKADCHGELWHSPRQKRRPE